jgi:hypothetical protein
MYVILNNLRFEFILIVELLYDVQEHLFESLHVLLGNVEHITVDH